MNVPQLRFKGFNEEWESKKLNTMFDFYKGKGLSIQQLNGTKYPAIIYGELYTKYHEIINTVFSKSDSSGFLGYKNDLLFPGSSTVANGTAQTNALMVDNVQLGGDIIIARPKQNNVNSVFMSYQINSQKTKLYPIIVGTTITHMYGKDLSKLKFMITNLSEQQKIGTFFSKLDDLITKQTHKVTLLKQLKQGYLQKLFPQAGQTTPQLRFKGFNDEWHEKYLKDVVQYENGKGHEQNISQNGDYIVVNSKYISSNGKIKKFTSMPLEILNKNMIVFVLSDVPNGKALAKALIIDKDNKYTLNQRIAGLTVDKNYNVLFIYYLINRNSYFLRFNDGVSQTNMSKSDVLSFKFLIPDLSEQQKIGALFAKLDHLIDLQNHKLQLLQELKKGYLQKMFI